MLINTTELVGSQIDATDDDLGRVRDLLFTDDDWMLRDLVVDTGSWLPGRLVLLSTDVLRKCRPEEDTISVDLTREEVEKAPSMDCSMPVSRQYETYLQHKYLWLRGDQTPAFGADWATNDTPAEERSKLPPPPGNPHLRSLEAVLEYDIVTPNGELSSAEGLMIDPVTWHISHWVIETGTWLSGRRVLLASEWIESIDWAKETIHVTASEDAIRDFPEYPAIPPAPTGSNASDANASGEIS